MEHHSLNQVAAENMMATYTALGLAVPGTSLVTSHAYELVVGDFQHSVCNFAFPLGPATAVGVELAERASVHPALAVYAAGDHSGETRDLLQGVGFKHVFSLLQMVMATPPPLEEEPLLTERMDRSRVARFMVESFFQSQSPTVRRTIARATATASDLQLFACVQEGRILGAAMLGETAGSIGLYNLCVASKFRGRGLGSRILREVAAYAGRKGKPFVLQCDSTLANWYLQLGFAEVGSVYVHCLAKEADGGYNVTPA